MTPKPSAYEVIPVPVVVARRHPSRLTPDQIYARNGKRRAVWLAAIVEEARGAGELAAFEPTPAHVDLLPDRHGQPLGAYRPSGLRRPAPEPQ